MDRHALTPFVACIPARLWQRSPNSTAGSAVSSVTLGEIAGRSPDEALQRLGSSADGLTTEEAGARLRSVGPNEVAHEVRHTILGELVGRVIGTAVTEGLARYVRRHARRTARSRVKNP